ncbi:unnamed protein product [Vitrella brassicaformis CCMP3155]|uniref:Uncharacterized protein n=1 Tax=Vitrella brassicaformis (strain CCMP3155) TaxID=1169540 RepID=A0A0G4E929_VITBC|nr:unnamed protein product [Vitrella brassicaformis CCMP3155]|eukprot:CEL91706.1 unnamed protein product [Vitrella brassicaformis CCMP3155]
MSKVAPKRQRTAAVRRDDFSEEAGMDAGQTSDDAQHSVDVGAFAQRFSQIVTHLVMDTYCTAERRFWCRLSFSDAFEWGRRLTGLQSIVVRCLRYVPDQSAWAWRDRMDYGKGLQRAMNDKVTAVVEGHAEGRRAAQAGGGTLESIAFDDFDPPGDYGYEGDTTGDIDMDEMSEVTAIAENPPTLPPPLDPPPTLSALTSITGLSEKHCPRHDRLWQLPSLRTVQAAYYGEFDSAEVLGPLVRTAQHLKGLDMEIRPDILAESLTVIPVAAGGGQPGPLSQLELVGTLGVLGQSEHISINQWRNGLERLQAVLVERGCHSIKQLNVDFIDGPDPLTRTSSRRCRPWRPSRAPCV